MKLPRIVRKIAGAVIRSTPILRRQILFSTDYRVLSGADEARQMTASSAGWLAARTVKRQERAYESLIAAMKRGEPSAAFEVADATRLPYADDAFDIVFNGVSLMHIIDYQAAIREAARVASRYCIFHSVPVFDDHRTTYLRKYAYGAPVVEVVFGKTELRSLCQAAGLRLEREWPGIPYDVSGVTGHRSGTVTYLFAVKAEQ
jgi:hypothetical protein